jgi:hypothetical protein
MKFQDYLATEHVDEVGGTTCWRLELTPPPEQLILHSWSLDEGQVRYPGYSSVLARDLDPESIIIQGPYEDDDLPNLSVHCLFYREAVVGKRVYDPAFIFRNAVLNFPLARDLSKVEAARKSLHELLIQCGARKPATYPEAVGAMLVPLRVAVEPASRAELHSHDKKTTFKQTVQVDGQKLHLIRQMERVAGRKQIPLWKLPVKFWRIRKALTPGLEWDGFELLSLDTKKVEVLKDPEELSAWTVSLYSVDRLNTTRHWNNAHSGEYRMWYITIYFPTEAEARNFAQVCASVVERIRECVYDQYRNSSALRAGVGEP